MALSNMQVYDTEIYTTTIELLGQKLEAFNAASGGTVVLNTNAWRGNYTKEAFFQSIAGAQRRVDRNAAIGSQAATQLSQGEFTGVKIAGGFGPITFEPGQMTYLLESPESAIMAISEGFSDALLASNKWAGEFTNARSIVMSTYFMAQFYITLGALLSSLLFMGLNVVSCGFLQMF